MNDRIPIFVGYTEDDEKIVLYKRGEEFHLRVPNGEIWALGPASSFEVRETNDEHMYELRVRSSAWNGIVKGTRRDALQEPAI